jgi:hypothetical protein
MGISKFSKLGFLRLWGPIILCANPPIEMSISQELSNDMWHTIYTQGNPGDSWLLVVENQIVNLTLNLSFGHNLCFKCPNGSCQPILDIYFPKAFQWYTKFFNPIGFDPYNRSLKIWKSIGIPNPKTRAHLGMWGFNPSHSPTLPGFPFGPHPCKPLLWSRTQS